MNKKNAIVFDYMTKYADTRSKIPNANNGRAYMCCLILNNNMSKIYSIGINKYEIDKNHKTIHAEIDAIIKLNHNKKKTERINIIVLTTNKKGDKLIKSECCNNCIHSLFIMSSKKNYIINKIYYMNDKSELTNINYIKKKL